MDLIKNPIIIGLVAGGAVYAYLTWQENEKYKKRVRRGSKKPKEQVNLLIPLAVTLITWFIAYAYFSHSETAQAPPNDIFMPLQVKPQMPLPLAPNASYKFTKDVLSDSSDPKSFSMITGGVTVPNKLPDVLLEIYDK